MIEKLLKTLQVSIDGKKVTIWSLLLLEPSYFNKGVPTSKLLKLIGKGSINAEQLYLDTMEECVPFDRRTVTSGALSYNVFTYTVRAAKELHKAYLTEDFEEVKRKIKKYYETSLTISNFSNCVLDKKYLTVDMEDSVEDEHQMK